MTRCNPDVVAEYVAKRLSDAAARDVAGHLLACSDCAVLCAHLRRTASILTSAPHQPSEDTLRWISEYIVRIRDEDDAAERVVPLLLNCSPSQWESVVAAEPELVSPGVVRKLLALTKQSYRNLPKRASEIAQLAVQIAELLPDSETAWRLRTDAYRQQSSALSGVGQFTEALQVLDVAETCIGFWVDAPLQAAWLNYARATILTHIGKRHDATRMIVPAIAVFEKFGASKLRADAKFLQAWIQLDDGHYAMAATAFLELIKVMRDEGDEAMAAMAMSNAGFALAKDGRRAEAAKLMSAAAVIFRRRDMVTNLLRLEWHLGSLQIEDGQEEEGLTLLRRVERDFEDLEMAAEAIGVSLEIVEAIVEDETNLHEVRDRCSLLVSRAHAAGMPNEAAIALAYLKRAARMGSIKPDLVRHVRQFLEDVTMYPQMTFTPPNG